MIAQELEVSLHMAFVEARQQRHEFITVEHLLLALLDNPSAAEVLRACAANIDDLRKNLTGFIKENTPVVPGTDDIDTQPTLGFQRVIQRAIMHVQSTSNGKKEVTGANVLVAIFGEKDSHAVYYLHQQGITRLDVVNYISHGITKAPQSKEQGQEEAKQGEGEEQAAAAQPGQPNALDQFTNNLNAAAKEGRIDPLIGREAEVERVSRFCVVAEKIIHYSLARPVLVRLPSLKVWRIASHKKTYPIFLVTQRFMHSIWGHSWQEPNIGVTLNSALSSC